MVQNLPANAGCKRSRFTPWVGKIPQRRKWQPTPVFLLGESHGQRSLVGSGLQGCKELDTTEATSHTEKKQLYFIFFFARGGGFQLVRGLCACGQHTVNFFHLVGVLISAKQLKDIVLCIPLGGTKILPQAALLFLVCPYLFLHLLPSLISTCLNLPVRTQGRSRRLDEASFLKTRNGDPERLLCPGTSQHPAGFQNP